MPSLDLPTMQARLVGGKYRLGPEIGGSRTGEVFAAEDILTGAQCVVKIISDRLFTTPIAAQRSERELKQLQKATSERIAKVLDVGRQNDRLWLAVELASGVTLAELLANSGPLPPDLAVRIVLGIGEALADAAKLGVIHRDVSPGNVMVDGETVKVLNFGLAPPLNERLAGTPEFLAPEQVDGKPADQRSNIYSLGVLLYTLLSGSPPFTGELDDVLRNHASTPPPPLSDRGVTVGEELDRVLAKALEKQSSRRHLTMRQLLGELEAVLGMRPPSESQRLGLRPRAMTDPIGASPSTPPAAAVGASSPTPIAAAAAGGSAAEPDAGETLLGVGGGVSGTIPPAESRHKADGGRAVGTAPPAAASQPAPVTQAATRASSPIPAATEAAAPSQTTSAVTTERVLPVVAASTSPAKKKRPALGLVALGVVLVVAGAAAAFLLLGR